jgi:hypothetical protein
MEKIKAALLHDWLPVRRGGEKVFEIIAEIFPEAPIYVSRWMSGTSGSDTEQNQGRSKKVCPI